MPTRRAFLGRGMFLIGLSTVMPAWGKGFCESAAVAPVCRAEVDFDAFLQQAYVTQQASQWCWAACISMVFAFHRHPVRQERIVAEAYGGIYDLPSGSGRTIARELDRHWIDDQGIPFRSRLHSVFDAHAGSRTLDNALVVEALSRGRPIIVGARDHTVVLTAVNYLPSPRGPTLLGAGVFDPWPGTGPRDLAPDEMTPLAAGGSLGFVAVPEIS